MRNRLTTSLNSSLNRQHEDYGNRAARIAAALHRHSLHRGPLPKIRYSDLGNEPNQRTAPAGARRTCIETNPSRPARLARRLRRVWDADC